jgi:toxin FitB
LTQGYLLDTNVLSATAPDRGQAPDAAKRSACRWIADNQSLLWLPVIAMAEIAAGIGKRENTGATRHAAELSAWLRNVLTFYPGKILGFGLTEALLFRQLNLAAHRNGIQPSFADISVASIAMANGLTIATRNAKHFLPMEVAVFNPFDA